LIGLDEEDLYLFECFYVIGD